MSMIRCARSYQGARQSEFSQVVGVATSLWLDLFLDHDVSRDLIAGGTDHKQGAESEPSPEETCGASCVRTMRHIPIAI